MPLSLLLLTGLTACSASGEPSCKSRTVTETLRQGIEQHLLGLQIYGQGVQVTNVEGSPVEQLQFGIACQAVVDISGVDLANLSMGGEKPASKVAPPFQIKVAYRVDKVDGELVTRWDSASLFQVVGMAAAFKAAEEADPGLFGRILGTPGR